MAKKSGKRPALPKAMAIPDTVGRKHAPGKMTPVNTDRGTFQMKANKPNAAKPKGKMAPAFGGKGGF